METTKPELQVYLKVDDSYDIDALIALADELWKGGARIFEVDHHTLQTLGTRYVLGRLHGLFEGREEPFEVVADLKHIEEFKTIRSIREFGAHAIIITSHHAPHIVKTILQYARDEGVKVYMDLSHVDKDRSVVEKAKEAEQLGLDAVVVHTSFLTKRTVDPFQEIEQVSRELTIPVIAAGALDEEHVEQVLMNGAQRLVIGRSLRESKKPRALVKTIISRMNHVAFSVPVGMTMRFYASQANKLAEELDGEAIDRFVELIKDARENDRKVYVCGTGRSRLVGAAFGMRLMHMGLRVHVIGEVTMPAVEADDIIVGLSGSGETSLTIAPIQAAHGNGATVVAITSTPESTLGKLADVVFLIHGRVRESKEVSYIARQLTSQIEELTPMGSLFEILSLIFLEGVVFNLQQALSETAEKMRKRHANIE